MRRRQGKHRNRDSRSRHIDGGAQGNGDGVKIGIQSETLAEAHIDGNIRGGAARKKCVETAFPERRENQRVGIFPRHQENDQRIQDQRHESERAEKHSQKLPVAEQRAKAAFADCPGDQPHNAEGRKADNPLHHLRDGLGHIADKRLRGFRSVSERDAEENRPREDADIIRVNKGIHRIVHHREQQIFQHVADAARRRKVRVGDGKFQFRREQERNGNGGERGAKRPDDIKRKDGADGAIRSLTLLCQRVPHEHGHEDGRDCLQRADKKLPQKPHHGNRRGHENRQQDTNNKAAGNQEHQRCIDIPTEKRMNHKKPSL